MARWKLMLSFLLFLSLLAIYYTHREVVSNYVMQYGVRFQARNTGAESTPSLPLVSYTIPSVHMIWCNQNNFEFRHYLAIRSVYQVLQPNKIVLHYDKPPAGDNHQYNQWYRYLESEIAMLVSEKFPDNFNCTNATTNTNFITSVLRTEGSVFFPITFLFGNLKSLSTPIFLASELNCRQDQLSPGKILVKLRKSVWEESREICAGKAEEVQWASIPCVSEEEYNKDTGNRSCVSLDRKLHPRDIWSLNTSFAALSRLAAYGKIQTPRPLHSSKDPMPKISHFIWLIDRELLFFEHVNLLSAIYVAGFEKVFVHGITEPKGKWWEVIRQDKRFSFIPTESSDRVFNQNLGHHIHHQSDVLRLEILRKYGGIYQDFDIVWVNRVPEEYYGYDMIISFDWAIENEWPEKFNNGLLMSKRNGKFLKMFIKSLKEYHNHNWGYNSLLMPYRIYELNPDTVFANRHIVVMCYNRWCHPSWAKNYQGYLNMQRGSPFNWRNETYALHFTGQKPQGNSVEEIKRHFPISGEAAANVYEHIRRAQRIKKPGSIPRR